MIYLEGQQYVFHAVLAFLEIFGLVKKIQTLPVTVFFAVSFFSS